MKFPQTSLKYIKKTSNRFGNLYINNYTKQKNIFVKYFLSEISN